MSRKKQLTKEEKRLATLAEKTEKQKKALVEQLGKTPIVQLACERIGIGRATYYAWRAADNDFARAADRSLESGRFFINDIAKSKLITLIQGGNMTAIMFWLRHNDPAFATINNPVPQFETATVKLSVEEINTRRQIASRCLMSLSKPKFNMEDFIDTFSDEMTQEELEEIKRERRKLLGIPEPGTPKKQLSPRDQAEAERAGLPLGSASSLRSYGKRDERSDNEASTNSGPTQGG